ILAEASFFGWKSAAKKYRIPETTFFRYKTQLKTNSSLKEKYEKHRVFIMSSSYQSSEDFLNATYKKLVEKIQDGSIKLDDPRMVMALSQVLKNASEYRIAQSVLLNDDTPQDNEVN
ncbi:MAG: hypothetical protein ACRC2M_06535, partial [Planktothrix sp.]